MAEMTKNDLIKFIPLIGFFKELDDLYAVVMSSSMCYGMSYSTFMGHLKDTSPTNSISFGDGDPNDPNNKVKLKLNASDFKERIKPGGKDMQIITRLCLVSMYQLWEDEFRKEIARSFNVCKSDVKSDIIGDIRILRNAVIHNNSNKISDYSKLKVLTYMQGREKVVLTHDEFCDIIELVRQDIVRQFIVKFPGVTDWVNSFIKSKQHSAS